MSETYLIETDREAAGVIVREGRGFRFLSASRRFWALEGAFYRTPREAERAARALLATRVAGEAAF